MAGNRARKVAVNRGLGIRDWGLGSGGFALIATLVAISAFAGPQSETQPTFRSEINFVQIPVRVLDRRGEFVRGLTQSDFQILEDGQPQPIIAFSAIDIPFVRARSGPPDPPPPSGEVAVSNEAVQVDGRVYVFVIDNESMAAAVALRTRHVMRRFIRDGFAANDIAAIVLTGTGRGQPFTRNPRQLNDAIDRLMSDADPSDNSVDRIMEKIADTARWMGAIKGRRKALVLITPSSICSLVNTNLQIFSSCNEAARYALRMAVQADVSIYTIDPRGAVPTNGTAAEFDEPHGRYPVIVRGPLDAARYLAEESGGFAVVNSNSLDAGFARVVRENSSYYLLGYYPTNMRADGKLRRNEIKLSRAGLRVVHRASYVEPMVRAGHKVSTTNTTDITNASDARPTVEEQLQELADNPLPVSAIPLRVTAGPFSSAGGERVVAVTVEIPREPSSPSLRRVRLSVGFYDRSGKSVSETNPTIDVPDDPEATLRFESQVPVPPGTYRLWVGAVEMTSGLSGSVMTEIAVRRPEKSSKKQ